tara:strand:- start:301 stop:567 length:267 start_codon:yes stop_codon:yes gene_type:complete
MASSSSQIHGPSQQQLPPTSQHEYLHGRSEEAEPADPRCWAVCGQAEVGAALENVGDVLEVVPAALADAVDELVGRLAFSLRQLEEVR